MPAIGQLLFPGNLTGTEIGSTNLPHRARAAFIRVGFDDREAEDEVAMEQTTARVRRILAARR